MITRRTLLGAAAGAGVLAFVPTGLAYATDPGVGAWTRDTSANGWPIDHTAIATHRVEGAATSVALRDGDVATVLLHIARRWHYEIAPLDTGEGGGIAGYTTHRTVQTDFESNYLSGTAVALHPTAYPAGGSERLWPHHETIVRDILLDCAGTVIWGGDLTPAKASHFQLAVLPGDSALIQAAARIDTTYRATSRSRTAGMVEDPAVPARRDRAAALPRPR